MLPMWARPRHRKQSTSRGEAEALVAMELSMKFGLHFGSRGVAGDPDTLRSIAQKAEALGYEHFGMSDHVIVATEVESAYTYSQTGKFFAQDTGISQIGRASCRERV